jgi:hypothetical protein
MNRTRAVARSSATLTRPSHIGIARRAVVNRADDAAMTLEVCLVPWGEVARVSDDGLNFYDESWTTGSLQPAELVAVYDSHRPTPAGVQRGELIGRAASIDDRDAGLFAVLELAATARGRDAYALARTLGEVQVSIEADVAPADTASIVRSADAPGILTGVAICWPPSSGAFAGAVGAARSSPDDPDPDPDPEQPTPPAELEVGRAQVAELVRTEVARFSLGRSGQLAAPSPFARFGSFDELHAVVRSSSSSDAAALSRHFTTAYSDYRRAVAVAAARVFVNQITADNPGVVPPAWLTEVFGLIDRGRPAVTALGGPRSPGDHGLDVHWPYYDGDLTAIVAEQTAEKSDINSVKVSFKRGQASLDTFAGGSDVSYQLQRRSSPSYMALYDRILQLAYGITTETRFVADLIAAATGSVPFDPTTGDADALRAFLFAASAQVRSVTGAPASAALASTDLFIRFGSDPALVPQAYGTQNVAGTAQASTLRVNVSGLEIVEVPTAPDGTLIVTNEQAASWLEEGPFLASAEDVQKLGTDVAIWGMGTTGPFLPAGIVKPGAVLPLSGRSSKSS